MFHHLSVNYRAIEAANSQRRAGGASGRGRRTSPTRESAPVRRLRTDATPARRSGADYFTSM